MGLFPYNRQMKESDIETCVEIVRLNWDDKVAERFREEVWHAFHSDMKNSPIYYVSTLGDEIITGFAGMIESWIMNGVWDFIWVNVHPRYHGHRFGWVLTNLRIEEVRKRGGSVINLVTKKYEFFRKFGFKALYTYTNDANWLSTWTLMTLQLKDLDL